MSQYRATRRNFLPPPNKSVIAKSEWVDNKNNNWISDKDLKTRPLQFKQWGLFESDQWDSRNLIFYVASDEREHLPRSGETLILRSGEKIGTYDVVREYPTKRKCTTYILRQRV